LGGQTTLFSFHISELGFSVEPAQLIDYVRHFFFISLFLSMREATFTDRDITGKVLSIKFNNNID
jgi:hypothetical protein